MHKWILIFSSLFLFRPLLPGQDQVGCPQLFEDAREAYNAGMVELVPELLLPCLESGLSGTAKQEAYKLVINAYLFDYLPELADSLMGDFLDDFPAYQATPSDPAEFVLLLRSHQRERTARGEQLVEREPVEEIRERTVDEQPAGTETETKSEEPRPRTRMRQVASSIGFIIGGNASFPWIVEPYSTGNPLEDEGKFVMGAPGFQAGVAASLPLGRAVETSLELLYTKTRFRFQAEPFHFTSYRVDENQDRIQLPVTMLFHLNPESQTTVYLRLGIMADYLFGATMSATRTYSGTGSNSQRNEIIEAQDIGTSRAKMNLYGTGAAGVRIPLSRSYFFIETRFQSGLLMMNREEYRFNTGDLIWLIYHIDSDFRINQLGLHAGIAWYL